MLPDFKRRQQDYLLKISQAMSAQLNLPDLLKIIIGNAVDFLAGQAGLIVLRQDEGVLSPAASIGLPRDLVHLFEPLWRDIPADLAPDGHDAQIPDLTLRLGLACKAAGLPLRQVVALPLTIEEQNLGYIFVFRARGAASFTFNDNQTLETFANNAAIAVHNASLYRQVTLERERLDAIIQNSGDGVMIINPFRIIRTWNSTLANLTGISVNEAVGQACYNVLNLQTRQGISICHTQCPILNPPPNGQFFVRGFHHRSDGKKIAFANKYAPQYNAQDNIYQFIANVRDITHEEEEEDLKETLLAVISHELKTPVSIIKGYAGTLAREDANWDTETYRDGLHVIEDEADKLNDLITNFLEASRLQTGSLKLHAADVFLPDLALHAVETLRPTSHKHQFFIRFANDFPVIQADYDRLSQVLTNLVSNAIKYSQAGGRIEVGGDFDDTEVRLYVTDDGIGIPQAEHDKIFERFHRVDNSLSRATPGTGLGLYLVKSVVEAHRGRVWVQSQPGQGSTFWFALPRD